MEQRVSSVHISRFSTYLAIGINSRKTYDIVDDKRDFCIFAELNEKMSAEWICTTMQETEELFWSKTCDVHRRISTLYFLQMEIQFTMTGTQLEHNSLIKVTGGRGQNEKNRSCEIAVVFSISILCKPNSLCDALCLLITFLFYSVCQASTACSKAFRQWKLIFYLSSSNHLSHYWQCIWSWISV